MKAGTKLLRSDKCGFQSPVSGFAYRIPGTGCRMLKGQSSLELLVTLGVVIAFSIPVIFLLLSVSSIGYEDTAKAQADATARTLADTINSVYAQGPGAQTEILVNAPPSTESISAASGEVVVRIKTSGGAYDAPAPTIARISGGSQVITGKGGLFKIRVRTTNAREVELSVPTTP